MFQRWGGGGVTLCQTEGTHQIVMLTSMLCFTIVTKKGLQKGGGGGGHQHPGPLSYALAVRVSKFAVPF